MPRTVGTHPETGEKITAGLGRFGSYIKHGSAYVSLPADDDVLTIGLNRAVSLLAEAKTGARRGPQLLREIGPHPEGGTVGLYRGRYGPYVSHEGVHASLPRGADADAFPLEAAIELIATQRAKGQGAKGQGAEQTPAARRARPPPPRRRRRRQPVPRRPKRRPPSRLAQRRRGAVGRSGKAAATKTKPRPK